MSNQEINACVCLLFYRCEVCSKGFLRRERYVTHVRIHTGEKPFVCAVCSRGYRDKRELKKHQASHNHSGNGSSHNGHTVGIRKGNFDRIACWIIAQARTQNITFMNEWMNEWIVNYLFSKTIVMRYNLLTVKCTLII